MQEHKEDAFITGEDYSCLTDLREQAPSSSFYTKTETQSVSRTQ
jgi:hypothetical protein